MSALLACIWLPSQAKTRVYVLLQVYFTGVVVPAVSSSVAELSSASSALLSLVRAVEDSITVVLRKCVDAFMAEVSTWQLHVVMTACEHSRAIAPVYCAQVGGTMARCAFASTADWCHG